MEKEEDPLYVAVDHGQAESVRSLIQHGANVNRRYENNVTILMIDTENRNLEIVGILLSCGAEVDVQTKTGWTALMVGAPKVEVAKAS